MEYQVFSAKTRQDAITEACTHLGVTSDRLDYIVDSEGSSGFFGIGSKNAVIRARIKEETAEENSKTESAAEEVSSAAKPKIKTLDEIEARAQAAAAAAEAAGITYPEERKEREGRRDKRGSRGGRRGKTERRERPEPRHFEASEEVVHEPSKPKPEREVPKLTEEQIEKVKADAEKFLTDVFTAMNLEVNMTIEYEEENGCVSCEFEGDEMGILIGKRGQTLDSLQYLTSLVVNRGQKDYIRVKLDTEEYRRRRKEALETLSRNISNKVKRTHARVVLEPMNPYERRIIHSSLQNNRYVETYSEGEEPYRRVVVAPKRNR